MVNNIEELWPAYNLNIAPSQASTEGLFQQTQAMSQLCAFSSLKSGSMSVIGIHRQLVRSDWRSSFQSAAMSRGLLRHRVRGPFAVTCFLVEANAGRTEHFVADTARLSVCAANVRATISAFS
jgi:hypothetical protein